MSDLSELAGLLRDKTIEGKLKWQLVADNRISIKQGTNILEIYNGNSYFQIVLRNQNGVVLSHEDYANFTQSGDVLKEIFDKARRDALGIDEAISDVRQRLLHL